MAGPIAIAGALSQLVTIVCPSCGHKLVVTRRKAPRTCPRCKEALPALPATATTARSRTKRR